MRLGSETGDFVEIERIDSDVDAYDIPLAVRVRFGAFAAAVEAWVERAEWLGFVHDLVLLEEHRQGEAMLASMSPGNLTLVVRSLDSAGHMGVEGVVGTRKGDADVSLRFGVLEFPPSQLVELMNGARAISSRRMP